MKKVLYVATMARAHIGVFHLSILHALRREGYETHVAARNDFNDGVVDLPGCQFHNIIFERNPFNPRNLFAYHELKNLINNEHFSIIHCHTPVGGVLTRIAARKARKTGTKIFYTAHGFHFYKGAPLKNWLLYYPIEKLCAHWTDVLITINTEDYALAKKKMRAKHIKYVPGIGINVEKFANVTVDRIAKRKEIEIPEDAFLLLSVGELNKNKNHEVIIRALEELQNPHIYYAIAGNGPYFDYLNNLALELGVSTQFHLLGYRNDVAELYKCADVYIFPSIREGLPVSVMEAMASGLPCIVSNIRGNADLITNGLNGYLCEPTKTSTFKVAIKSLYDDKALRYKMVAENAVKIRMYKSENINKQITGLYRSG